ncbi:dynein regulatory complex protein 9-like [Anopheles nili]|uniref:dynein regulatory complex protein 9-like n=1 Tax=Anopheles nili TaxID=185578 RepID=UPI00237A733D|nr:dynein regulatory complex protein 9-like [Anopheles nili]
MEESCPTINIIRIVIKECLRKLEILSWCCLNETLKDATGTFTIASLLRSRKKALQSIDIQVSRSNDSLEPLSKLPSSNQSLSHGDYSASGEDRVYYDRFHYLDRCKVIQQMWKKVNVLKLQHHGLNRMLHKETQVEITKQRFIKSWETARKEQLQQSLSLQLDQLHEEQLIKTREHSNAIEAAALIEQYYDWKLACIERDIDEWMSRFDREKEQQDSRFQKARATEKIWNELKHNLQLYELEVSQLEANLKRLEERVKYKELCQRMAVKLQAWWRGVMVRKGFGTFDTSGKRKKTKSKGKGSKKAKK